MTVTGLRIGVVGGSIAGCAMAIAAVRAGAEVTVHERSDGALQERGFGIAMPPPLHHELVANGYLGADMETVPVESRVWLTRAPGGRSTRELARQTAPVAACNWGLLWRALHERVRAGVYRRGLPVESVARTASGRGLIRTGDGEREYDIVVGADGFRSVTRERMAPDVRPVPAGYLAWRGTVPLDVLGDLTGPLGLLRNAWVTLGFPGGHAVFYAIPGPVPGSRLLAHVVYGTAPQGADPEAYVGELAVEHFPAEWAEVVVRAAPGARAHHPVADLMAPRVAEPPFLLAGDAAGVTRPHTASGAVKALQDALCLERALRDTSSVADALGRYADERTAEGTRLVELGRRLGRDLVEHTPDWATMGPAEVEAWSRAALGGDRSYLYGSVHRP
ncbi:FAD-dependent monooxygenase [Streptomyces sp. NPDC015144]|uniref:FAD-dependent monooxygenase n=1 Tax=Streptomyces sp. NPDC015144 TaxID=3364944 RepID=UPI0036F51820